MFNNKMTKSNDDSPRVSQRQCMAVDCKYRTMTTPPIIDNGNSIIWKRKAYHLKVPLFLEDAGTIVYDVDVNEE